MTHKANETNDEFLQRIMNFGCPTGALVQAFILMGIENYAQSVANTDAKKMDGPFISGESWKRTGEWVQQQFNERYAKAA